MLKILDHRGYWKTPEEKNSLPALNKSLNQNRGIETDIRDCNGELVIAHNPADALAPKLDALLSAYSQLPQKTLLALNVKADGLYPLLSDIFNRYNVGFDDYFLFDMSLPEQYMYIKHGFSVFTRSSEFEPVPAFINECKGVWLDQFTDCNHIINNLPSYIKAGKIICVVSPELHSRPHEPLWEFLQKYRHNEKIYICTDKPDEAEAYFQ